MKPVTIQILIVIFQLLLVKVNAQLVIEQPQPSLLSIINKLADNTAGIAYVAATNQPLNGYEELGGPPCTWNTGILKKFGLGKTFSSTKTNRYWITRNPSTLNGNFNPQDAASLRISLLNNEVKIFYQKHVGDDMGEFPVKILGYYQGTGTNDVLIYGTYGDFGGFITISLWRNQWTTN